MVSLIDDGILVRRLEFDETSKVGERAAVTFRCGANSNVRHAITTEGNGARVLQGVWDHADKSLIPTIFPR